MKKFESRGGPGADRGTRGVPSPLISDIKIHYKKYVDL
jgi:hypothetical protein